MPQYKRPDGELFTSKYATLERHSRGRQKALLPNEKDDYRSEYLRDSHRIIYSQSFRRLRHKTQVFYFPENDHVSTRMEHVLLVASAARSTARNLRLNEDLAEAIGLGHDIGHAPFGHEGENILRSIIEKPDEHGFSKDLCEDIKKLQYIIPTFHHEIYGLRVVDEIALRDREEAGLNLTWEVRDGIVSHCG